VTIDWFSRYVVAWRLSNTLDSSFCLEMLDEALCRGRPEVFNTDQGVQFTADAFAGRLEAAGVAVEEVPELRRGLARYFAFSNHAGLHQSLGRRTCR
jgi:putative transposase